MQAIPSLLDPQKSPVSRNLAEHNAPGTTRSPQTPHQLLRVLLIDPDPCTLSRNVAFLERIPGFQISGLFSNINEGAAELLKKSSEYDFVILGLTEPKESSLLLLGTARARGITLPVIIVSSIRSRESLHRAVALGASDYLLTPLSFALFAQRVRQVRPFCTSRFPETQNEHSATLTQLYADEVLTTHHPKSCRESKKGVDPETLAIISRALNRAPDSSAAQIACLSHLSRVTARRYLEHLVEIGRAKRTSLYGATGRPSNIYQPAAP